MAGGEYQLRLRAIGADQGRLALSCNKGGYGEEPACSRKLLPLIRSRYFRRLADKKLFRVYCFQRFAVIGGLKDEACRFARAGTSIGIVNVNSRIGNSLCKFL